jgi:hypothetical protein
MPIAETAILVAGFALGHAAWSVSDLPAGELLVPMAIVVRGDKRELVRFAASTQSEAIAKGKATLASFQSEATAWAFVRDGLFPINGKKTDVLIVEVWSKEAPSTVTFIQRYQPFSSGQFKVLGAALVGIDGIAQGADESKRLDNILYRGVSEHPKAGSLWAQWYSN